MHGKTLTTHHHEAQHFQGIAQRDRGHWEKGVWVLIAVRHLPWALPLPLARLPKGMASCSARTFCSACRLCSRGPPYFMVIHPIGPQVDRTPHLCHRRLFRQRWQDSLQGLIKGPRCRMPRSLGLEGSWMRQLGGSRKWEHVRREREVVNNAPLPRVTQPLNEAPQPIQVSPPQVTQVPAPVTHQVNEFAAQAVEALRTPAQTAAAATSGFWSNLWSGLQGSQQLPSTAMPPSQANQASVQFPPPERVGRRVADHSAQLPTSQVSQLHQASSSGTQSAPVGGALPSVPAFHAW